MPAGIFLTMQGSSLLLRCLTLVSMACLTIGASPIAAQATGGKPPAHLLAEPSGETWLLDDSVTWTEPTTDLDLKNSQSDDPYGDHWFVGPDDDDGEAAIGAGTSSRFADIDSADVRADRRGVGTVHPAVAVYGPFRLIDPATVEMVGTVDTLSPRAFATLLAAHPGVRRLVMVECPGSVDETANHALARAVRRAGLSTHVPRGGSVRSGAVDLFLAGVERTADASAQFGVHSWRDEDGYEARDFPADDPVHAEYVGYYREMGLDPRTALAFYALTNSVGFDDVRMLSAAEMARLGLVRIAG